jgi:hypothetical protein
MAGQKATIDKDSNHYLNARPDGEAGTAYHSNSDIEKVNRIADRNGNGDDVFNASKIVNKDKTHGNSNGEEWKSRKNSGKDQKTKGTSGDMGSGLERMESVFDKILAKRFGIQESENPGVASSSATSDNPSLGMYSVNNSDFKQSKADVKAMLEGIALQAAEAFEVFDDNSQIPDALSSELDQCTKVLGRLYEYVTNSQRNNPQTGDSPVQNDPANMPVRKEETEEDLYVIRAESITGETFESEEMTEEEAMDAMEEMLDSEAYSIVEAHLSSKQKKIAAIAGDPKKIDSEDLATLRAKRKMQEAVIGVTMHILNNAG